MNLFLSVVIPCYNEEQNIRLGALDKVARYMEEQKYTWEVLVVDDGSSDESLSLIKKFITHNPHFRVIANNHEGKAGSVVSGMLAAGGRAVLFSDLDQSTPLDQVEKLLPWLSKGYDIVIGSRKGRRQGAPLLRKLMGVGFMMVRNLMLGLGGITDTQCGFKLFKNEVAKEVFSRLKLYSGHKQATGSRVTAGFDVELLFVATQLGYSIKEVGVEWHYVDTRRVSPLADSLDALIDIAQIRLNSWRGLYTK
jgi:glycosyltransferase involved in cell wall biosynthesis